MPTVLKMEGLSFDVYSPDHVPPHVHVFDGIQEAVITIETQGLLYPTKMKAKRLKLANQLLATHQDFFISEWKLRNK